MQLSVVPSVVQLTPGKSSRRSQFVPVQLNSRKKGWPKPQSVKVPELDVILPEGKHQSLVAKVKRLLDYCQ